MDDCKRMFDRKLELGIVAVSGLGRCRYNGSRFRSRGCILYYLLLMWSCRHKLPHVLTIVPKAAERHSLAPLETYFEQMQYSSRLERSKY